MKKLCIVFVILSMIMASLPVHASAPGKAQIMTPRDGSVVYDSLENIEFYVPSPCDITAYLDGDEKEVYGEDDTFCFDVGENLSVGRHTVEIVCINEYGSSYAKSTFDFAKTTQSGFISNNFDGGDQGKLQFNSKLKVGTNASGEDVHLVPGLYTGKDGDEKGAVGVYRDGPMTTATVNNRSSTYIYINTSSLALTGRVILEYDIRLEGNCECGIETKNQANGFGTIGASRLFTTDGYVYGTDFEYKKGEWMHVKHIVDVPNGVEDMWIDGEQVFKNRTNTTSTPTNRTTIIRFQAFVYGTEEPYGFAIDNVYLGQQNVYEGFKNISFKNENGEFETAENDVVSKVTDELKIKVIIPNFSVNATTMPKLYADGKLLELENAELDEEGNLLIKLKEPLPESGKLTIESTVPFGDGYLDVKKEFSAFGADFGVMDAGFSIGGALVRNSKQLLAGKELKTNAVFTNDTEEVKNAVVITAIYQGKKLVGMKAHSVAVEPSAQPEEIDCGTITIPDGENFSVECFMFDGYLTRKPLADIWKIF